MIEKLIFHAIPKPQIPETLEIFKIPAASGVYGPCVPNWEEIELFFNDNKETINYGGLVVTYLCRANVIGNRVYPKGKKSSYFECLGFSFTHESRFAESSEFFTPAGGYIVRKPNGLLFGVRTLDQLQHNYTEITKESHSHGVESSCNENQNSHNAG